MAARSTDGRQITGNTRMPVRNATSSTAERMVGSTIARVRAPADRPIGAVPVAVLAVPGGVGGGSIGGAGGGISVAVAVRGRGDGRVGGWRFPGPFPVDAALEIHGRATRLQGRNQIDLTAGAPDVFDTYRTPWPVSRMIPDLADDQVPGQELTAAGRALARTNSSTRS